MKLSINKNVLENLLVNTQNFQEKKDLSQITSHVLLTLSKEILTLKATDYEIGISIETRNIKVIDEGVATANGRKFLEIIRSLKDDEVTLETINDYLYIKQKNSKFKIPMFNPNEFPPFPTIDQKQKFDINSTKLLQSIKKILPAIDTNNPKFELNGALFDILSDAIHVVGTDTRRLAISTIEQISSKPFSLILPKKAIAEIQKIFYDDIALYFDENTLIAKSSSFLFFTKLINGKYPDYQRIIPKETLYQLTLNRDKMIDAIKQVLAASNEIKITFKKEKVIFESLNEDNIEGKTEIDMTLILDEPIVLAVNSKYVLDFLTNIPKNSFTLGYNDASMPFVLESDEFKTIVMPIML